MSKVSLQAYLSKVLATRVVYFNNEVVQLKANARAEQLSPLVVVVARRHYQEVTAVYPITNRKELSELLKYKVQSGEMAFHKIDVEPEQRQSTVTTWVFNIALTQRFPNACLLVPETVLLGVGHDNGTAWVEHTLSGELYLVKKRNNVSSIPNSPLINTISGYLASVGLLGHVGIDNATIPVPPVTPGDYLNKLLSRFYDCPFLELSRFLIVPASAQIKKTVVQCSALALAAFVFYQLLSSVYFVGYGAYLKANEQMLGENTTQLLDLQTKSQAMLEDAQLLSQWFTAVKPTSPIWYILTDLKKSDVLIINLTMQDDIWLLSGRSKNALETLASVKASKVVQSVSFNSPTRNEDGLDSFQLKIILKLTTEQAEGVANE